MRNLTLPFLMMVMGAASAQQTVLDMRPNLRSTPLPRATQQRVLKEVLSLKGLPACTQREGGEVRDHTSGHFTRPGARQDAYLVYICGGEVEGATPDSGLLVMYENGKIIKFYQNIGDAIGNVGDLNLDGVDDLLFISYFGPHMGDFMAGASVVTVKNTRFHTFLDLDMGEVYSNACGNDIPTSVLYVPYARSVKAALLTVKRAKQPIFTLATYQKGRDQRSYKLIGRKVIPGQPL